MKDGKMGGERSRQLGNDDGIWGSRIFNRADQDENTSTRCSKAESLYLIGHFVRSRGERYPTSRYSRLSHLKILRGQRLCTQSLKNDLAMVNYWLMLLQFEINW